MRPPARARKRWGPAPGACEHGPGLRFLGGWLPRVCARSPTFSAEAGGALLVQLAPPVGVGVMFTSQSCTWDPAHQVYQFVSILRSRSSFEPNSLSIGGVGGLAHKLLTEQDDGWLSVLGEVDRTPVETGQLERFRPVPGSVGQSCPMLALSMYRARIAIDQKSSRRAPTTVSGGGRQLAPPQGARRKPPRAEKLPPASPRRSGPFAPVHDSGIRFRAARSPEREEGVGRSSGRRRSGLGSGRGFCSLLCHASALTVVSIRLVPMCLTSGARAAPHVSGM